MRSSVRHSAIVIAMITIFLPLVTLPAARAGDPTPVIFDTDIGNDVDDVIALAMLHAMQSRGECRIAAVTVSKDYDLAGPFVDAVNTFYGRGDIPIGVVREGPTRDAGKYLSLVSRYPHRLRHGTDAPNAVTVLRQVLGGKSGRAVVIIQVGFSTNLARLLDSPADSVSKRSGVELARDKVRLLSVMGGAFGPGSRPEYNVVNDIASAKKVFETWPTPVAFSGFEVGAMVEYPSTSIRHDFGYVDHHPLVEAYWRFNPPPHNRSCWDPTAVLFALRPDRHYFGVSPPGEVTVNDDGSTQFRPTAAGTRRYLTMSHEQVIRATVAITELATAPPVNKR